MKQPGAGHSFYDLVPAQFNQLLLFDDRLIHAVQQIQGTMAPQDGRVVIHGHICEGGIFLTGGLAVAEAERVIRGKLATAKDWMRTTSAMYHGCVALQLTVDRGGRVRKVAPLSDRIYPTSARADDPERVVSDLIRLFLGAKFPPAAIESIVTVPVMLGSSQPT